MHLKQFMVKNPISVRPDDSLYHAAQIMAWTETHHLPVTVGDDRLVGILSERDVLAYRAQQPDHDPKSTPLSNAMHGHPETAGPDSSLSEAAARLAQSNIGCLPVTEKGKLVGLVTRTDVLSAEVSAAMSTTPILATVADVMTRDPITVSPDEFLLDAAKLMSENGVRHLPVIDGKGRAVGILSDRDVQAVIRDPAEFARSTAPGDYEVLVSDAMSRPPMRVWATENCSVVAGLFVQFHASATLVTAKDGTLEGIVSYIDLLRSIAPSSARATGS